MKLALVYPPSCDPTAPYLALPMLAGFLRPRGVDVTLVDANLEAYLHLLRRPRLLALAERIESRLHKLERSASLDHRARLLHHTLWRVLGDAHAVPDGISAALSTLREPQRFYDPEAYGDAVQTIDAALRVIAAAYAPLQLDFTCYRTPFALTSAAEISADAAGERDPFHGYLTRVLIPQLRAARVRAVGLSVCFPGQLQPAYAFAMAVRRLMPGVHLTVGGPAMTQLLVRQRGAALATALGPFDSAVMYEGEHGLLALCEALDGGGEPDEIAAIPGVMHRLRLPDAPPAAPPPLDLRTLPAPDYDGMPLGRYLAPETVLPYDPTRGCYWGKCAFCHYGLTDRGTARYRERDVETVVQHLRELKHRHGARVVYFSQDAVAPRTLERLSRALRQADLGLRWATDLRPERSLTPERAKELRLGGAVACALGVESSSKRVLQLINKGVPPQVAGDCVSALAAAGIAAEIMAFTGFPTETPTEALETLRFIEQHRDEVAAFIVGRFELTHGSAVAREPDRFGVREVWTVDGDELGTALFYAERGRPARSADLARMERALDRLSSRWMLRRYPWAGSLSTAHTVLWYERLGPGVLRALADAPRGRVLGARPIARTARFDPAESADALSHEQEIWQEMVVVRRRLSRSGYDELAARAPRQRPRPCRVTLDAARD